MFAWLENRVFAHFPAMEVDMTPARLTFLMGSLVAAAFSIGLAGEGAGTGAFYEKSVDPPRETKVPVGIDHRKGSILWLESHYEPNAKDVARAKEKDPTDKKWMLLRFTYRNDDYVSYKVNLQAVALDENGAVIAEGGRRSSLDARKQEDTISFPLHVRTLDWPKVARVKILATFLN